MLTITPMTDSFRRGDGGILWSLRQCSEKMVQVMLLEKSRQYDQKPDKLFLSTEDSEMLPWWLKAVTEADWHSDHRSGIVKLRLKLKTIKMILRTIKIIIRTLHQNTDKEVIAERLNRHRTSVHYYWYWWLVFLWNTNLIIKITSCCWC